VDLAGAAGGRRAIELAQMGRIRDLFATTGPEAVAPILLPLLLGRPDLYADWEAVWRNHSRDRLVHALDIAGIVDDSIEQAGPQFVQCAQVLVRRVRRVQAHAFDSDAERDAFSSANAVSLFGLEGAGQ